MSPTKVQRTFLLFTMMLAALKDDAYGSHVSGLYVDDDSGQTVAHKVDTLEEKISITKDILDLLNLPYASRRKKRGAFASSSVSAFQYIYEIYKNTAGIEDEVRANLTKQDLLAIQSSSVITSYSSYLSPSHPDILRFDISDTPQVANLISAELHLHRKQPGESFTLQVYRYAETVDKRRQLRLLEELDVAARFSGWLRLNVSEMLEHWLRYPGRMHELKLIVFQGEQQLSRGELYRAGLSVKDPASMPFIVAYFESALATRIRRDKALNTRWKRSSPFVAPGLSAESPYISVGPHRQRQQRRRFSGPCRARGLHVRFNDLEFDNFIVAPESYQAQFCAGECRFPLQDAMNASNHALLQTMLHFLKPDSAPEICCVPQEVVQLPVLYSRDGETYVIKKYDDMVVKSCACL